MSHVNQGQKGKRLDELSIVEIKALMFDLQHGIEQKRQTLGILAEELDKRMKPQEPSKEQVDENPATEDVS
jgi:hypothetical protein